jgi:hypothetical protein
MMLAGCDYYSDYSYILKNNTQHPLVLNLEWQCDGDSTFQLPPSSEKLIYVDHSLTIATDRQVYDTLRGWLKFELFKNDTIPAITNFRKRNEWTFEILGKTQAKYTAEVNDSDF